jgi:hypothetical protein
MQNDHSTFSQSSLKTNPTAGPLEVSPENPRYFAIRSGRKGSPGVGQKTICLTGSRIWNNFHDGMVRSENAAPITFSPPFSEDSPVVLHLKRV